MSYSTRVNLHGHCSMCSFLLISVHTNFSLSSPCTTTSTPHFLFLRCTQTHPHRKINTKIHLLKKKRYTNTPTHKQTQTEKQKRDRSVLIGTIGARRSRLIGARGYGSCLIGTREIGACGSELGRSELWIGACDRSYGSVQLWIGAVDRCCCGSMLVIGAVIRAVDR